MKLKMHALTLLFLANFIAITFINAQPQGGAPFQLTEQDVKELQTMEQEINKVVSQMSPEEQTQFNKEVEDLTKVMETMDEDQLVEFMQGVFAGEQPPVPQVAEPTPEPAQPTKEEPEPIKKEEKPKKPSKKESAAVKIIQEIIKHTNNFLVKIEALPDFPGKIKKWGKKGSIKTHDLSQTWDALQNEIEQFVQILSKLDDKDPKTGKYKYIADLLKDKSLYNNLSKLHTTLVNKENSVEVPAFGLGKMSKVSKKATYAILNDLMEALYETKLLESINKIIATYEPRAKELSEEEEKAKQKALDESKKQRMQAPKVTGGTEAMPAYGSPTDYGYDPYAGYGSDPYTDYGDYGYSPIDASSSFSPSGSAPGRTPSTSPGKAGEGTSTKKEDEKDKKDKKLVQQGEQARSRIVNRQLKRFEDNIETVADIISSSPFEKIEKLITSKKQVNLEFAQEIGSAMSAFIKAKDAVGVIKRDKKINSNQKARIKKDMQAILKQYEKQFDDFVKQVNNIKSQQVAIKTGMSADKLYAYFADSTKLDTQTETKRKKLQDNENTRVQTAQVQPKTMTAPEPAIKSQLPTPTSLFTLVRTYEDTKEAVKGI